MSFDSILPTVELCRFSSNFLYSRKLKLIFPNPALLYQLNLHYIFSTLFSFQYSSQHLWFQAYVSTISIILGISWMGYKMFHVPRPIFCFQFKSSWKKKALFLKATSSIIIQWHVESPMHLQIMIASTRDSDYNLFVRKKKQNTFLI